MIRGSTRDSKILMYRGNIFVGVLGPCHPSIKNLRRIHVLSKDPFVLKFNRSFIRTREGFEYEDCVNIRIEDDGKLTLLNKIEVKSWVQRIFDYFHNIGV